MRKFPAAPIASAAMLLVAGCAHRGYDRARPDEFLVARQAPLVIPPDYSLQPPQPGAARPQDAQGLAEQQTLAALFGGPAPRSPGETAVDADAEAGGDAADAGIRSDVGDPSTNVVDKGSATRDIVAAPAGDGQDARASTDAAAPAATTSKRRGK